MNCVLYAKMSNGMAQHFVCDRCIAPATVKVIVSPKSECTILLELSGHGQCACTIWGIQNKALLK